MSGVFRERAWPWLPPAWGASGGDKDSPGGRRVVPACLPGAQHLLQGSQYPIPTGTQCSQYAAAGVQHPVPGACCPAAGTRRAMPGPGARCREVDPWCWGRSPSSAPVPGAGALHPPPAARSLRRDPAPAAWWTLLVSCTWYWCQCAVRVPSTQCLCCTCGTGALYMVPVPCAQCWCPVPSACALYLIRVPCTWYQCQCPVPSACAWYWCPVPGTQCQCPVPSACALFPVPCAKALVLAPSTPCLLPVPQC